MTTVSFVTEYLSVFNFFYEGRGEQTKDYCSFFSRNIDQHQILLIFPDKRCPQRVSDARVEKSAPLHSRHFPPREDDDVVIIMATYFSEIKAIPLLSSRKI